MAQDRATADDVVEEGVTGTDNPSTASPVSNRPNAFAELMRPKTYSKPNSKKFDSATWSTKAMGRRGLGPYTEDPASFPQSRVVYYNDKFTVIKDLYPKASVHLLLLPRDRKKNVMKPQDAFDDPEFLEDCRVELEKVRQIAAEELRQKFGQFSRSETARREAMAAEDPPSELPKGRDWSKDIKSGIHANPSMSHVHIHVLSRDMVSEPMKKSNHYLSFTTDFLVDLDQFPLSPDDYRRHYKHFPDDMVCWRCGQNFGNKMTKLKEHLAEELEEWKGE